MFTLEVRDTASEALAKMPDRLRMALAEKAGSLAAALEARVRQKLEGGVLNMRSGALARAIVTTITEASGDVTVDVAVAGDIKYAAIHEFGGVIPPHEIVPDKAKALAFLVGGKQAFAERVNLPAITMPERSYLRSSLAEMTDTIREDLSEAVTEAVK
jgi:phage gpG-like protein